MTVLYGLVKVMVIIFRIIYNTKKPFGNGLTYVASYTLFWLKFSQVFIYPRYLKVSHIP